MIKVIENTLCVIVALIAAFAKFSLAIIAVIVMLSRALCSTIKQWIK